MSDVIKLIELQTSIKLLNVNLKDELLTQKDVLKIKIQKKELETKFSNIAMKHYLNFRRFCQKNEHLFMYFYPMKRNTDEVIDIKLKPNKKAVFVLLNNTFDNCQNKSVVLVPYSFIENPDVFLEERKVYLKKQNLNNKRLKLTSLEKEMEELKEKIKKEEDEIENFDSFYEKHISTLENKFKKS